VKKYSLDIVIVLALFCIYATCSLFLCVIGADVYRSTADTLQRDYNERTSVLYVAEKVRKNDTNGGARIDTVNGTDALVLIEQQSGKGFETWLFVQDRVLYEGVFASGAKPDPKICQPIMPMNALVVGETKANGSLITITFFMTDNTTTSVDLWLRSGREVGGQ
jgi:hypothetical protein